MSIDTTAPRTAPRASLDAVLAFAWTPEPFTSGDAMAATSLTRSTTIEALQELIAIGLISELPNARATGDYRVGRPSRRFAFRADAALVIGLDADREHLDTTVADLLGAPLVRRHRALDPSHDSPDERRRAVLEEIDEALAEAGADRSRVLSVCVGVPAPVDADGSSPEHRRDDFWRRMNPALLPMLEDLFPVARVENDATLAAVAESRSGAAIGCSDFVALLAGARFGAGIVTGGRILRGAHGGAGEMMALDHVAGVRSAVGLENLLIAWAEEAGAPAPHTAAAVLEAASAGAAWAVALIDRAGDVLARVAAVFGSLYDPERVVVLGSGDADLSPVLDRARGVLPDQLDLPAPELVLSTLRAATATGAVAAAVEAARSGVLHLTAPERSPLGIAG